MKKGSVIIIGIVVVIAATILWGIGTYNELVSLREDVDTEYSNVSVTLERRADLIPNLVNTVKGYTAHEDNVISEITKARQNLLKADNIEEKSTANDELSSAIGRLMVIVENYPDLKASTNFINLQDELSGTENRIATARRDYEIIHCHTPVGGVITRLAARNARKKYNTKVKKAPTNIIASIGDFDKADYFKISEAKKDVPNVEF